ncbi:MAG: NGG1p interacting factor NIF3, partial [Deferrisomatales bacterium]
RYRRAVAVGLAGARRGPAAARAARARARREFEDLKEADRAYFDPERLENPYPDSRLLHGDFGTRLGAVLVGIDVDESELLLADRLRERGRAVDAVVGHHPRGIALAQLAGVMEIQAGIHGRLGVPIAQAEGVLAPRLKEVAERLQPVNHQRAVDAARLLGVPLLCLHTPSDNCVARFLTDLFDRERPPTLADLLDLLHGVPEYDRARRDQAGPVLVAGEKRGRAGQVFVDMTGGTEGAREMYQKFAQSTGVSTIVGMHLSKEHVEEAKKHHLNVVLAGHVSSDNLGMNLLLDACLDPGVEVIEASGFRRVERRG